VDNGLWDGYGLPVMGYEEHNYVKYSKRKYLSEMPYKRNEYFMPHSHHSHSGQFCKHGFGELEEVVKEAIRQRFEVYGLTEHVPRYRQADLYPEEVKMVHISLTVLIILYRRISLSKH